MEEKSVIETTMEEKIERAKELITDAVSSYPGIAVAYSFGKESMVVVHIAREVEANIKNFSVMTRFKPRETFDYLKVMNEKWNLGVTVYMVADAVPEALRNGSLKVELLPAAEFNQKASQVEAQSGLKLYEMNPDECCRLLKVDPTKVAVRNLDAWITGLRCTEGQTRVDYKEIEEKGGLIKVNPILNFTEAEIWRYIATRDILPHPWYGLGYRSLGCAPCSAPGGVLERDCRWIGTSKCGGECGIHTQQLK